jgi:hypothetical protein
MSAPPGARCGRHPEAAARAICERCGDFVCPRCIARRIDEAVYCPSCARLAGEPFVWERRDELGLGRAWWATVVGVLTQPRETFAPGFRDRSVVPALGFGLIGATPVRFLVAVRELLRPSGDRAVASGPVAWLLGDEGVLARGLAAPVTFVLGVLLLAVLFGGALRLVHRGPTRFSHVVRAVAYVHGATAPLGLVGLLPSPVAGALELGALALSFVLTAVALGVVTRAPAGRMVAAAALVSLGLVLLLALVATAIAVALSAGRA